MTRRDWRNLALFVVALLVVCALAGVATSCAEAGSRAPSVTTVAGVAGAGGTMIVVRGTAPIVEQRESGEPPVLTAVPTTTTEGSEG